MEQPPVNVLDDDDEVTKSVFVASEHSSMMMPSYLVTVPSDCLSTKEAHVDPFCCTPQSPQLAHRACCLVMKQPLMTESDTEYSLTGYEEVTEDVIEYEEDDIM